MTVSKSMYLHYEDITMCMLLDFTEASFKTFVLGIQFGNNHSQIRPIFFIKIKFIPKPPTGN